jgi:hypothetical protein
MMKGILERSLGPASFLVLCYPTHFVSSVNNPQNKINHGGRMLRKDKQTKARFGKMTL